LERNRRSGERLRRAQELYHDQDYTREQFERVKSACLRKKQKTARKLDLQAVGVTVSLSRRSG